MAFSGKKLLVFGLVIALLIGIPLTVFLVQKQQNNQSHATASTTLKFVPESSQSTPLQKNVGDSIPLDIMIDPGRNVIQALTLDIIYDPAALSVDSTIGFQQDQTAKANFPSITKGPVYTPGHILVQLSTVGSGADITSGIKVPSKVGTLTVKGLSPTTSTQITFSQASEALSVAGIAQGSNDSAGENVLLPPVPAFISVGNGTSPTGGVSPGPTSAQAANQPPDCTALNVDRNLIGPAPLALTFTAIGNDTDGTISKATFNFGDGPTQDVTTGGGIGTNSVNAQIAHQFNNPGTYPVSVLFTDNRAGLSNRQSCTKTVVVSSPAATRTSGGGIASGGTNTGSGSAVTSGGGAAAPVTAAPVATLPKTGPGDKFVIAGSAVAVITLVGGILFLAL